MNILSIIVLLPLLFLNYLQISVRTFNFFLYLQEFLKEVWLSFPTFSLFGFVFRSLLFYLSFCQAIGTILLSVQKVLSWAILIKNSHLRFQTGKRKNEGREAKSNHFLTEKISLARTIFTPPRFTCLLCDIYKKEQTFFFFCKVLSFDHPK